MIHFNCPFCGKAIAVRDEAASKKGKCHGCGKIIQVPETAVLEPKKDQPAAVPQPELVACEVVSESATIPPVIQPPKAVAAAQAIDRRTEAATASTTSVSATGSLTKNSIWKEIAALTTPVGRAILIVAVSVFLFVVFGRLFWTPMLDEATQQHEESIEVLDRASNRRLDYLFGSTEESPKVVTKSDYDQLRIGMSYRRVVSIIGTEGEELSQNRIEGVPGVMESVETIMYMWKNDNGSNMNAMFQNDKLMQKAQFGLE